LVGFKVYIGRYLEGLVTGRIEGVKEEKDPKGSYCGFF
jgi:hypothetical protein